MELAGSPAHRLAHCTQIYLLDHQPASSVLNTCTTQTAEINEVLAASQDGSFYVELDIIAL